MEELFHHLTSYGDVLKAFFRFDPARLSEPGMIFALCLQALLFVLSAFFSGSETALFSLSRLDLQKLRRERHPRSETLHALLDQPRRLIISILCGNELVNIAATANLAGILVQLYGEGRAGWIKIYLGSGQRVEEQEADEHAPEAAADGAAGGQVDRLMQLDFVILVLGNHDHIFHLDQILFLHFGKFCPHLECGGFIIKTDNH